MPRSRPIVIAPIVMALCVLGSFGLACQRLEPDERLEKIRSSYTADLSSFTLRQQPVASEVEEEAVAENEGEAVVADEPADDATEAPAEPVVLSDLILDILIGTDSDETLSGLTLDFELVDAGFRTKERRQFYLDVSQVAKGSSIQATVVVEDVDYVEGDQLRVSVRTPVPVAERGSYREFADLPGS